MPTLIDPARFTGKAFIRRSSFAGATNDYCLVIDGLTAGRVMETTIAKSKAKWFWTITGPHIPPELHPSDGYADTLKQALAAFSAQFWQWQQWALSQRGWATGSL